MVLSTVFLRTTGLHLVYIKMEKLKTTKSFKILANNENIPTIEKWLYKEFGIPGTQWGKKWFSRTVRSMETRVITRPNQIITRQVPTMCRIFYFREPAHATLFALRWSSEKMG